MDIVNVRRLLHQHPELGYAEHWTSDYIAQQMTAFGYEVVRGIAKTGVVGILRGESPELGALAYRADMDALPILEKTDVPFCSTNGCMHACGHDSHMAVALDVAQRLAQQGGHKHSMVFLFQPNEEGAPGDIPSGGDLVVQEGTLARFDIRRMIALHSDPTLAAGKMGICPGPIWAASGRFVCRIQGESAHAAYPAKGRDALWTSAQAVSAIYAALARRRPALQEVVSICTLQAGHAFNVIADSAVFEGIVRATSRAHLNDIFSLIRETAENIARACGTTACIETYYGADAVVNDLQMTQTAQKIWQSLGCAVNVEMNMAAEDFAYYSNIIPTFYAMMGVKPPDRDIPPSHSDKFTIDESALPLAANAMLALMQALDADMR